jgi:hypothetical protein
MVILLERSEILVHEGNEYIFSERIPEVSVGSLAPVINIVVF